MEVEKFYRLAYFGITFFGASLLSSIWYIKQRKTDDHGYGYFALAIWMWVIIDVIKYYLGWVVNFDPEASQELLSKQQGYSERLASMLNNAFFLCALTYLSEAFILLKKKFASFRDHKKWTRLILISAITLALFFSIMWGNFSPLVTILEVIISSLTLAMVGVGLFQSFNKRGYGYLFTSIVVIISFLLVLSQPLISYNKDLTVILPSFLTKIEHIRIMILVSHSALIGLLLSLAISWIDSKKVDAVLTKKQLEVIKYLYDNPGLTYGEIADKMRLEHNTIKTHMSNIRQKLNVKTKKEIIHFAEDNKLFD